MNTNGNEIMAKIYGIAEDTISKMRDEKTAAAQAINNLYGGSVSTSEGLFPFVQSTAAAVAAHAARYTDTELATFDFIKIMTGKPAEGLPNKIYLVPKGSPESQDIFDEWIWANDAWEYVGTKVLEVDLSNYYSKAEVDALTAKDLTSAEVVKLKALLEALEVTDGDVACNRQISARGFNDIA